MTAIRWCRVRFTATACVYVCTGFDAPKLLAIRPDGKGDVTDTHVVWTVSKNAPNSPSPLLLGDELYMVSDAGVASCLDAKTGEEIWHERIGGHYSASPIAADGKIYFLSEEGVGVVVKAGRKFELVAKNPLNEKTLASYGVLDGEPADPHGNELVSNQSEVNEQPLLHPQQSLDRPVHRQRLQFRRPQPEVRALLVHHDQSAPAPLRQLAYPLRVAIAQHHVRRRRRFRRLLQMDRS